MIKIGFQNDDTESGKLDDIKIELVEEDIKLEPKKSIKTAKRHKTTGRQVNDAMGFNVVYDDAIKKRRKIADDKNSTLDCDDCGTAFDTQATYRLKISTSQNHHHCKKYCFGAKMCLANSNVFLINRSHVRKCSNGSSKRPRPPFVRVEKRYYCAHDDCIHSSSTSLKARSISEFVPGENQARALRLINKQNI